MDNPEDKNQFEQDFWIELERTGRGKNVFSETDAMDTGLSHGKGSMGNDRKMHKICSDSQRRLLWNVGPSKGKKEIEEN